MNLPGLTPQGIGYNAKHCTVQTSYDVCRVLSTTHELATSLGSRHRVLFANKDSHNKRTDNLATYHFNRKNSPTLCVGPC